MNNDKDARDMADLAFGGSSAVSGDASEPQEIAALVVRDVCESDPADPNKPETLCVNVNALAAMIVNRLSDHLASQASLAKRGTEPSDLLRQVLAALESCGQGAIEDGGNQWFDEKLVDAAYEAITVALAESAPSEKLSGAEADGEVVSTNRGYSTVRWLKPKGDPENAWSYPVGGTKVYLASHAETVPHVPAGQGEQS